MLLALACPERPEKVPVVLLVEDHRDTRAMYSEFLRGTFEVLEASDGEQALTLLRTRVPDLIVTDLSLPGMDGFQLIVRVRQEPSLRDLPVISLSGFGGHVYDERARLAGCDRTLQKPCLPDALAQAVTDLLRERSTRSRRR